MKIGINVPNVAAKNRSGVDLYVQQLAQYVPKADPKNTYYLFVDSRATKQQKGELKHKNVKVVQIPFLNDQNYAKALSFLARIYKLDLIHFLAGAVPKGIRIPYVISVFDLTFEQYPEFYDPEDLVKQKATQLVARQAHGIIAISQATKDDLVRFYNIDPSKIAVTHLAPKNSAIKSRSEVSAVGRPFLLFVGNIQPRKNLVRAIEALALIPKASRPLFNVVGNTQDKKEYARLRKTIKAKKLENDVAIRGYLNETELTGLYHNCLAIYYPSLYEGFGYNVLEAFMYKKPIVLSNVSSLPEVAGKAGVYVDPESAEDIAKGIQQVLKPSSKLKEKIAIGSARLKKFTPQIMAEATIDAYQKFSKEIQ